MSVFPTVRMRRLRQNPSLRKMLAEVRLSTDQLIAPLFVGEGTGVRRAIGSMPGQFQFSVDSAMETVRRWSDAGLPAVLLFGLGENKDAEGSDAWDGNAAVQRLIRQVKKDLPHLVVFTDVCLCEYTAHGHCGPVMRRADGTAEVNNDEALDLLSKVAVSHAAAGADVVAPSAMMDGQIQALRNGLDLAGYPNTPILSYAVKFASSLYGPFREAAGSAPQFGDRRSYQMDYRAPRQSMPEAALDVEEGADMIMVKPAAAYLDVIAAVRARFDRPLAAYHVSGEYSMIKAAAANGWLDEKAAALEITSAIRRAGADLIITYFAEDLARWLR